MNKQYRKEQRLISLIGVSVVVLIFLFVSILETQEAKEEEAIAGQATEIDKLEEASEISLEAETNVQDTQQSFDEVTVVSQSVVLGEEQDMTDPYAGTEFESPGVRVDLKESQNVNQMDATETLNSGEVEETEESFQNTGNYDIMSEFAFKNATSWIEAQGSTSDLTLISQNLSTFLGEHPELTDRAFTLGDHIDNNAYCYFYYVQGDKTRFKATINSVYQTCEIIIE